MMYNITAAFLKGQGVNHYYSKNIYSVAIWRGKDVETVYSDTCYTMVDGIYYALSQGINKIPAGSNIFILTTQYNFKHYLENEKYWIIDELRKKLKSYNWNHIYMAPNKTNLMYKVCQQQCKLRMEKINSLVKS